MLSWPLLYIHDVHAATPGLAPRATASAIALRAGLMLPPMMRA